MAQNFDLLIRGGAVVNHDGVGVRDIGVRGGRIAALGALTGADAAEIVDARGLHILPGVIDTQVHFREPGAEHKEDLQTGSLAAVMGGVTSVFEMPNTEPQTVTAAALRDKLDRARGRMHCDHALWVGGTAENVDQIPELERLPGAAGIKVFMGSSTGNLLVADDEGGAGSSAGRFAAPPSIRRTSSGCASAWGSAGTAIRPAIRSGATQRRRCPRRAAWCGSRARPAPRSTCCMSPPPRRCASWRRTRTLHRWR